MILRFQMTEDTQARPNKQRHCRGDGGGVIHPSLSICLIKAKLRSHPALNEQRAWLS